MLTSDRIEVIGAHTQDLAFGLGNGMPWPWGSLPDDMRNFKEETSKAPEGKKNLLIAFAATADAIGKPLPGRMMMVISRKVRQMAFLDNGYIVAPTVEEAFSFANTREDLHHVFFIGGEAGWKIGLRYASRCVFTEVRRPVEDCEGLKRLEKPLRTLAEEQGFVCVGQPREIRNPKSWALNCTIFEYWREPK